MERRGNIPMPQSGDAARGKPQRAAVGRSGRHAAAAIFAQTMLGVVCIGIWGAIAVYVHGESAAVALATCLPYFVFYVLGILSRYVPGLRGLVKRMQK